MKPARITIHDSIDLNGPLRYVTVDPYESHSVEIGDLIIDGERQISISIEGKVCIVSYHVWVLLNSFVENPS